MLILTRKPGERVFIGGGITVTVLKIRGRRVVVGIDAPRPVAIRRGELPPQESRESPAVTQRALAAAGEHRQMQAVLF